MVRDKKSIESVLEAFNEWVETFIRGLFYVFFGGKEFGRDVHRRGKGQILRNVMGMALNITEYSRKYAENGKIL